MQTDVISPLTGVIGAVYAKSGDHIETGGKLFDIIQTEQLPTEIEEEYIYPGHKEPVVQTRR